MSRLAAGPLAADRRGATALLTALSLIVVLGFVGFGIDFGAAYASKRAAQGAADSAAYSGAVASLANLSLAADQARAVAAQYGLVDGAKGVSVAVRAPPLAGAYQGRADALEVVVTRPAPRFFGGLFMKGPMTVAARAVAARQANPNGNGCILSLNQSDPMAVLLNGTPVVDLAGCSVWVNSNNGAALSLNGGAIINASQANVVGNVSQSNNTQLNAPLNTGVSVQPDPYANVALQSFSGCDSTNATVNSGVTQTFAPKAAGGTYVFCNGLTVNGGAIVTFKPGVYVIDGGWLLFNGQTKITGAGVTFVLTNHTGTNIATTTINGGADINLSAPSDGPYAGMLFYQDRRAALGGTETLNGGSKQILGGALYFPRHTLLFNGGTDVTTGGCTQILADKVTFNGNARLAINCAGTGVRPIASMSVMLVE